MNKVKRPLHEDESYWAFKEIENVYGTHCSYVDKDEVPTYGITDLGYY